MALDGLREFMSLLEQRERPRWIAVPVPAEFEITEVTDMVSKGSDERNVALLSERARGSELLVLINAFGSAQRMAWALGVDDREGQNHQISALIELRPPQGLRAALGHAAGIWRVLRSLGLRPKLVGDARCQESVLTGDGSPDALPIPKCWSRRGGRYITLPSMITPRSGHKPAKYRHLSPAAMRRTHAGAAPAAAQGQYRTRARGPRAGLRAQPGPPR
jgi:4-hydroxy-3-polyprenylbenzoate decarboxylase